jgi:hypothetical protein
MWSVYHGAVATNVWQAKILNNVDPACINCDEVQPETLVHKFHHCPKTTHAWSYTKTLLYKFVNLPPSHMGMWPDLTWQQCLVGSPLPRRLKPGVKVWSLLRGLLPCRSMASGESRMHDLGSDARPCSCCLEALLDLLHALSCLHRQVSHEI